MFPSRIVLLGSNMLHGCRSDHVSALTALLFVIIPILRVLFNVFPFYPNRWFGLGFLVYYCIATPLLYKVRSPQPRCSQTSMSPATMYIRDCPQS